jgi:signal transduction histidine kinase
MFRERFQLSRERLEFYYSIGILILIPVLIVANTLIMSLAVRNNFDSELRHKAALANSLITESIRSELDSATAVQKQVSALTANNDELAGISIVRFDAQHNKTVVASGGSQADMPDSSDILLQTAATSKKSIAQQLQLTGGDRIWRVVSPIIEGNTVKAAVISDVSSKRSDSLIGNTLLQSLGIVFATVILIVLLLLNHFKFVQYAMLFRRLKEVDQLKNDFLSVATHELRAPMTVIKGSIENLEDGITGTVDEKGRQSLEQISAETDRLNNLVSDLLNVSRLEQGRITYTYETLDTREACQKIVNEFTTKAHEKGLTVDYQSPDAPELISADKGRITEVMTNLVDNAIKYSRQGSVVVSHKSTPEQVILSVRDTGIGMAAQDRERLFSRFYRVQNDSTKGIPGTGLGLWIIKQYIEAMHGTISVDSMVGVGTEFVVTFPRAKAPEAPGSA